MILNRKEFADYWDAMAPDMALGQPSSILWTLEKSTKFKPSVWFVKVAPLNISSSEEESEEYFNWNQKMLVGQALCYASSEESQEEWWGFTHYEDIFLWKLRWEGK